MADGYRTEEEQIEALKSWWRENGKSTLAGIALALIVIFGWQAWQKQQAQKLAQSSALFDNLVAAVNVNQGQLNDEQLATANHLADTLLSDFTDTTYAGFARLYKAQLAVKANDLPMAAEHLTAFIANTDDEAMLNEATLRLAKVRFAQEQFDQALALVEGKGDGAYLELKGDILLAEGKQAEALDSYKAAQKANEQESLQAPLLAMKIQHLSSVVIPQQSGEA